MKDKNEETPEAAYLRSVEERLDNEISAFLSLSANLYVGHGGDCSEQDAELVEDWMKETMFRATILADVLNGRVMIGWNEESKQLVLGVADEQMTTAFQKVRNDMEKAVSAIKEGAEKISGKENTLG